MSESVLSSGQLTMFDFQLRTRVVCGEHAIDRLGDLTAELAVSRVLLVTDPGIVAAGHVERALHSIRKAGVGSLVFDGARENPTTDDVEKGLAVAKDYQPDLLIGLGGGSSIDCAKGINFLYSCGGVMHDYWGVGKATADMLPMIAVPTTAGTGSELQSFALISDAETHVKMACGDKRASCRIAILDPCLTTTQPAQVTALTAVDALSHAVETYVTTKRNPISNMFSRESFRLLIKNFKSVFLDPDHLEARAGMQLGAAFGGLAIENSMLGASHALANPLTAAYGIAHGQAVGVMLPHVVRFNGIEFDHWYEELIACVPRANQWQGETAAERLAGCLTQLVETAGLKVRLSDLSVDSERLDELSQAASQQWTGNFNPRPVGASELLRIYHSAM